MPKVFDPVITSLEGAMVANVAFPLLSAPAWPGKVASFGAWTILLGVILAASSGPLNRFTSIGPQVVLLLLAAGVVLLAVGALLAIVGFLIALARRAPLARGSVAVAIVVALGLLGYLLTWLRLGLSAPPIHEISTDLAVPPPFVEVVARRQQAGATYPPDYIAEITGRSGRINVPEIQRKAYPDIQPAILPGLAPARAFVRVEAVVQDLGWELVAAVPEEGRIEATDTSRFFGFRDDVVIRMRAEAGGTRVDARSKSRTGFSVSDLGSNARRLRRLLELVKAGA
ncbi:MAG: DUF1499 domain-containing protein [Sinobacteraceae bacterium]|nr:DUF1499 domain-containing protein [Nevskiaceae bacterium]MCP5359480.1 DUF1499 domain-containing protein [Nevskiaceae bacterium]MCP5466823.1 DUF1499 domain-containing protein [Nevskiaceae bacterium]MCP5470912.1 DUF1499 domain-containing protein [Nevskiaceae bacterium]